MAERQLTTAPHGHVLTNAAVWTPDSEWIVYDTRPDAAGAVFEGKRIERVHRKTGDVQLLYEAKRGARCGVATCNPRDERIAFIRGPEFPTIDWSYSADRRQGIIVETLQPGFGLNLDARDLSPPFTPGALRGGSHVHIFSPDGAWVSFTYDDHVLTLLDAAGDRTPHDVNQRNVAVAMPRPVSVPRTHPRNHDGEFFSAVVTRTVNHPRPGSDDISRAYEEAWIAGGARRSLAFLGDCAGADGRALTELFVVELPEDLSRPGDGPLEGTPARRPAPPAGTVQRRITFTAERKHPGVFGPRHWPRSSPDGGLIAFLMRDDEGTVQLWTVPPAGGEPRQATRDSSPVTSAFSWNPQGTHIAYLADDSVFLVEAATGRARRTTPSTSGTAGPRPEACVFSPDGRSIALVRPAPVRGGVVNQIHVVDVEL
ncbi:MAG TPA: DUF3748 domain-containing protein [Lacipirellulaceae bacterium]|nr:DUF3748 domain-containing protein [Lacipirellulaceae bacterium]